MFRRIGIERTVIDAKIYQVAVISNGEYDDSNTSFEYYLGLLVSSSKLST